MGKRELDVKGFDGIEVFPGGEEAWSPWSWKLKVATKAMSPDLVELMKLAEAEKGKSAKQLLDEHDDIEDKFDHRRCLKASGELYSFLTRYTSMEAATVVKGARDMDGVEAYGMLHENYSKRTMGRMFRVQRECMYPKAVKELGNVKKAIMDWEEKWNRMKAELGAEVKIPDLWRMSALLEICPQDLKEQMLMRLDEIGEDYEALKHKILTYATNKIEQTKGGGPVPMDVDHVNDYYDYKDGEWEESIDGVWPSTQCYECGGYGHMARNCPHVTSKGGKAKGKGKDGGKAGAKGKGKDGGPGGGGKAYGWGKAGGIKGKGKGGKSTGYQGQCWRCLKIGHKAAECMVNLVDDECAVVDDESADVGGVWTIGGIDMTTVDDYTKTLDMMIVDDYTKTLDMMNVGDHKKISDSIPGSGNLALHTCMPAPPGLCRQACCSTPCRPRSRNKKTTFCVEFARGAAAEEVMEKPPEQHIYGAKCMCMPLETQNKFSALDEEENEQLVECINGVEMAQEVVEVTVDSGASKSVWPMKKKGVVRCKRNKQIKLAAANGSPIHVEGDATLNFKRGDRNCAMKFLDADVKRPLAAVSAIVDEGNKVVFDTNEAYIENNATKERIPMVRKNGVFVLELAVDGSNKVTPVEMEMGALEAETADADAGDYGGAMFWDRLDERDMGVFRRRA